MAKPTRPLSSNSHAKLGATELSKPYRNSKTPHNVSACNEFRNERNKIKSIFSFIPPSCATHPFFSVPSLSHTCPMSISHTQFHSSIENSKRIFDIPVCDRSDHSTGPKMLSSTSCPRIRRLWWVPVDTVKCPNHNAKPVPVRWVLSFPWSRPSSRDPRTATILLGTSQIRGHSPLVSP